MLKDVSTRRVSQASVAKVMTRDCFKTLMKYIHLNDNSAMPSQDDLDYKLSKVKSLMDALLNQFKQCFYPFQHLCIDEALIKHKGGVSFLRSMPHKPIYDDKIKFSQ